MFKKLVSLATAIAIGLSPATGTVAVFTQTIEAAAVPVRQTDVSTASEGNTLVPIRGNFYTVSAAKVLDRINAIRKEACEEGVINPKTGKNLTLADYNPIKWSSALEQIAQTRAAEASVYESHTRPNGQSCFSCTYDGQQSWAEDLAWNWSGMMDGIEQWYEEKADWVKQNSSAVTGHYTSMINPSYNHVALGCFRLESGGWYAVSGEFSFYSGLDESAVGVSGLYDQMIEVPANEAADYAKYAGKTGSTTEEGGKDTTGQKSTEKKTNTLTVSTSSKTYKQAKLKKAQSFSIGVKNAQGKVTYALDKAGKKAKIKVSAAGKVTVPKKCKKGTYKITVTAAGNDSYSKGSKTVTIKVK